jgi:ABC-type transporter Mla subunit MlaD
MLIRISLILAIIAGLAVGALNFTLVKQKVTTLQDNLKTETAAHVKFEADYNSTKKTLEKTTAQLNQTNAALVAALTDRDKAVAAADTATKRAADLSEKLAKTTKDLSDTKDELVAYQASGFTSAQVLSLVKDLKALQDNLAGARDENKVLGSDNEKLRFKLKRYEGEITTIFLPPNLKGKILNTDPKWDFVVLDIGEDQGVKQDGELLVSRSGKLVAKIIVRSVQKDRCIANVMPDWKLGDVLEGDLVIPAHPAS